VVIQVLTQAREHIIRRTFEALEGVNKAVVHLYNSTSELQRRVVFGKGRDEIKKIATDGAELVARLSEEYGRDRFIFQYSPESFTGTEMDYAAEVCNAVIDIWHPAPGRGVIINLPSTVEMATPNVYADQIEYMCRSLKNRRDIVVSLHAHNDRGTGVASTELGLLAGADRVEGTLFGNGERTGNADIMNLAMNLYSQGIDPGLDFSDIDGIIETYESYTGLPVHPRHPYAGDLVFTAFSGSHQDAIKKGMDKLADAHGFWEVPYLPIDPVDVGRNYDRIVRVNSQSGKGGVAFVLEKEFGLSLPKAMQQNFGPIVTGMSDGLKRELQPKEIYQLFDDTYINIAEPLRLVNYSEVSNGDFHVKAVIEYQRSIREISGSGNGIMSAFCAGLSAALGVRFDIKSYNEHSMEYGSASRAITYLQVSDHDGRQHFGAGVSSSISKSSLLAIVSAVNRMLAAAGPACSFSPPRPAREQPDSV
jgi:2-isopropylmalate synthase